MLRRRPFAAVSHIAYDPPSQHTILLPIQRWGLTVRTRRTASHAKPAAHRSTAAGSGVLIVMSSTLYRNVPTARKSNWALSKNSTKRRIGAGFRFWRLLLRSAVLRAH